MDLDDLKIADVAETGVELTVVHPGTKEAFEATSEIDAETGKRVWTSVYDKPLGMYITVLGQDSSEYQRRMRAWINKIRSKELVPFEDTEKYLMETRIACVVGWRGIIVGGEEIPCTKDNVRKVLTNPNYRFLCDQIDAFHSNRANFIVGNASSW